MWLVKKCLSITVVLPYRSSILRPVEYISTQIFVAVLGASNYTFANASASQKEADWIEAYVKAIEFFGGGQN